MQLCFRNAKYFSVEERETGTRSKIWNAGTRILVREKKNFEKARGNAEREEEMKESGHASDEGPAGTRAQLCIVVIVIVIVIVINKIMHFL